MVQADTIAHLVVMAMDRVVSVPAESTVSTSVRPVVHKITMVVTATTPRYPRTTRRLKSPGRGFSSQMLT